MSWLKSAVNRAAEVGGNNNITRVVRNYADTVVFHAGNAVSGGARVIQDRFATKNMQSYRLAVKRLEEVSVACRGIERVQLLRRWLVSLKEIARLSSSDSDDEGNNAHKPHRQGDDAKDSPKTPTPAYYTDPGMGVEPMTFREVFLNSQALEGITLSMILDAPNEEEVGLILELFRLCLYGGKDVHEAVMSNIKDLARAFSTYHDEVLAKREELLEYAQGAIAGLKINANLTRIDTEVRTILGELNKTKDILQTSSKDNVNPAITSMEGAFEQFQTFSRLERLLLKKKSFRNGNSLQLHNEKVDKLKILLESLANSTSKAEKRILEHRNQKEEALDYRVCKTKEVSQMEKDLAVEIMELEMRKNDIEAELKKVSTSLVSARVRLRNAREEREQFDEASNQLLIHLKSREDELVRSASSCRSEGDVINSWIIFLENTWNLQTKNIEEREKQVNGELEMYWNLFVDMVFHLLSGYKDLLEPCVLEIKNLVEAFRSSEKLELETRPGNGNKKIEKSRKDLEKEYLNAQDKALMILGIVEAMKKQYDALSKGMLRKDDQRIRILFDSLDGTKEEFESIERPFGVQSATTVSHWPSSANRQSLPLIFKQTSDSPVDEQSGRIARGARKEMSGLESVLDDGEDLPAEEINDWEFDALEKDAKVL